MMDLQTENRIAAILMREAAELRRQAEQEGVRAYLERPKVRGRPNSRFLTATVLGVQQANKAAEVNEMWQIRQKELELDNRSKLRSNNDNNRSKQHGDIGDFHRSSSKRRLDDNGGASCSTERSLCGDSSREGEGLRDEELEKFLQSRIKRGRGAVGSRMDEPGPYLCLCSDSKEEPSASLDVRQRRVVLGPEKPCSLRHYESSDEELDEDRHKRAKKVHSKSSDKRHSRKHKSKEKSKDKKKREKDKHIKH